MMFIKRLPRFEYYGPSSLKEAIEYLSEHPGKAKVIAGGTDLLVSMKERELSPAHLVNLKGIDELKGIQYEKGKEMRIGSLVTLAELEHADAVQKGCLMLRDAVEVMAAPQIRSLGTIGGNLCSASPSADTAPPLIASGAAVSVLGPRGERKVHLEEFFRGPGESVLEKDEILTHIFVPEPPENSGGTYLKLMRRNAMDLAIVGVAVYLEMDHGSGQCKTARIALGAVAPTPIRARKAESLLEGMKLDETLTTEVGKVTSQETQPIDDVRASGAYRRKMVEVMTKRAIMRVLHRMEIRVS